MRHENSQSFNVPALHCTLASLFEKVAVQFILGTGQIPAWLVGRLLLLLLLGSGQLSQIRHAWFVIDVINHSSSAPSCLAWLASPSHDIRSTTPVNTKQRRPLKASVLPCVCAAAAEENRLSCGAENAACIADRTKASAVYTHHSLHAFRDGRHFAVLYVCD